jgi:CheY-like chemotaxis protein
MKQRLGRECDGHERLIRETTLACISGKLEAEVALHRCALELHSLKGIVGLLGFTPAVLAIGDLSDVMLAGGAVADPSFWKSFQPWFASLLGCVKACADGRLDNTALAAVIKGRNALLQTLSRSPEKNPITLVPTKPEALAPSAGRRLLLIDDSATVRAALSVRLGERGYPVRAAKSMSESAIALLEFNPEIVVTDVQMPDVAGDEICRIIKANMKRLVPVIFYSSLPPRELKARARAAGADGYVHKDAGIDALVACMNDLLSDEILF